MKYRTSEEVQSLIAKTMAEADALQSQETMTDEDKAKLAELVASLEALTQEQEASATQERMERVRAKMNEAVRPAPKLPAAVRDRSRERVSAGEGFGLWLAANGPDADRSAEAVYRARTAGFDIGSPTVRVPVNYGTLNRKQRTVLTKGGTASGAEYVWQSYSDKVVEYLTHFSPVLGMVSSETTADANNRTYFRVDDTSMESAYLTASSGTESNPTIPEANIATGNVVIGCFDITSGYQKISFQELRDSYINLEDKVAKANSNSHARKLEREIVSASGNGTTGVQGLLSAATALTAVASWTQDNIMDALLSIPQQYRQNAVFMSNDATRNAINKALRDDIGRSLFDTIVSDDQEFDTLLGKKYVISEFVTANTLLIFVPEFYQLRMVQGQLFQQFTEKFWPHHAWAGIMSFGGAWVGPAAAAKKIALA